MRPFWKIALLLSGFLASVPLMGEQLEMHASGSSLSTQDYSVWLVPAPEQRAILNRAIRETTAIVNEGAAKLEAHVTLAGPLRFRDEAEARGYFAELLRELQAPGPDGSRIADRLGATFDSVHHESAVFFQNTVIRLTDTAGLYEANRIAVACYNRYLERNGLTELFPAARAMPPEDGKSNRFHLSLAYGNKSLSASQVAAIAADRARLLGTRFEPCAAILYQLGEYPHWTEQLRAPLR